MDKTTIILPGPNQVFEYDFELFDWNVAMENFQASVQERVNIGFPDRRAVRSIGEITDEEFNRLPSIVSHHAELIPQVKLISDIIESKRMLNPDRDRINSHLFASFIENSAVFDLHHDECDTYVWQIIGTTNWYVEGEEPYEHVLEPNQMIYIPKYVKHRPIITGPRVSVSFSVETGAYL